MLRNFSIMFNFAIVIQCIKILLKKIVYKQIFFFICSPYYGNVGDHTIFLSEKEMLNECGVDNQIIEITSQEYRLLKPFLSKVIRTNDVILVDGGGNFGDTWPETQRLFNSIFATFHNNRILVFPESWFFSNSESSKVLLKETKNSIEGNPNIIVYARDSYSFEEMKKNLNGVLVKYAFDCVLYKDYKCVERGSTSSITAGLSIRNDKESTNHSIFNNILEIISKMSIDYITIQNDLYKHIDKKERTNFFNSVIQQYEKCNFIITDRFHGFIFSVLAKKPCIIINNTTGKVWNFYNDIKDDIDGCICRCEKNLFEEDLNYIISKKRMTFKETFDEKKAAYKKEILEDIIKWKDQ